LFLVCVEGVRNGGYERLGVRPNKNQ